MITAVDVGATKTLVAQFDHGLQPVHEVRFETPTDQDLFLKELGRHLQLFSTLSIIVIGVPGIVDSQGVILKCGNLPWKNFKLRQELTKTYDCPVHVENDAKLAGLGEINALSPIPDLGLYLTVSTGIGSGIIINGKLPDALKRSEAGHIPLWYDGKWQEWEDLASGNAIRQHFGKMVKDIKEPADLQWIAERLTLGLSALIPILQPQVIVFGGSVGHYFDKYSETLSKNLRVALPDFIDIPTLSAAKHADEAVLYGCYFYATHKQIS